jgi:preprotein translocase subunit SecD
MKTITLICIVLWTCLPTALFAQSPPRDGIYLVQRPGDFSLALQGSHEMLYFNKEAIVTQKNIINIQRVTGQSSAGEPAIRVKLDPEGAENVRQATQYYRGERFGLIFKGRLLAAPVVDYEINSNEFIITGDMENPRIIELEPGL